MISETAACRQAALEGRLIFLSTGTGVAAIKIYAGTRPASAADAPGASVMLVQIDLTSAVGAVSGAALTLNAVGAGLIAESGVATWARVINRNGATAFDMDVGLSTSSAECKLVDTTLYAGGQVALISASLG